MVSNTSILWFAFVAPLLLVGLQAGADERHGKHTHDPHHQHDRWEPPPAAYANARSTRWNDTTASARGQQLYQTYCMVCHGTDGKGTGPAAKGLQHPPADLTHHFHRAPGDGDAYLFWRVSEGGQVEPFKSMQSAMPAFKTVLTEEQRWDVLAYVHTQFHRGFTSAIIAQSVTGEGKVIAVVPASAQLVVQHGVIKGFMDAMTMGYKVTPPSLLDGFKAGDTIRFTIDTQNQVIVKLEKLHN